MLMSSAGTEYLRRVKVEIKTSWEGWLLGRGCQAALTLQREWVRWRGELMSLGVDERSPSAAEASEMMEGWREWQGLILKAAAEAGDGRVSGLKQDICRICACCCVGLYLACRRGANGTGSVDSVWLLQWGEGLLASPTPDCRSPPALMASPESDALARL